MVGGEKNFHKLFEKKDNLIVKDDEEIRMTFLGGARMVPF